MIPIHATTLPGVRAVLQAHDAEDSVRTVAAIHQTVPAGIVLVAHAAWQRVRALELLGLVGVA